MNLPPPPHRTANARAIFLVPWLAVLACLLANALLRSTVVGALATLALLVSTLFLGLPHGAGDWWVLRRAMWKRWNGRTRLNVFTAYTLAALGTAAVWVWLPPAALTGFLLLTAWHFGTADATVLLPDRRPWRGRAWWLFGAGRGLLAVFAPLTFRPDESAVLLRPFAAVAPSLTATVAGLERSAPFLLALGVGWSIAGVVCQGRRAAWLTVETGLLLALYWSVPPLLGFVCYWVAFHCWRHVLRIAPLVWFPAAAPAGPVRALASYHWRTLPLTLLSLAGLWLIFRLWPALSATGPFRIAAYLILLSALTVPHAAVIGWLDWKETAR